MGSCKSFDVPLLNDSPCAVSYSLTTQQSVTVTGLPEDMTQDPLGWRHCQFTILRNVFTAISRTLCLTLNASMSIFSHMQIMYTAIQIDTLFSKDALH